MWFLNGRLMSEFPVDRWLAGWSGPRSVYSFVTVSSRFRIKFATIVYAASSLASSFVVALGFADRQQLLRCVGLSA